MTTADAELPPSSALAFPIVITIPSSRPADPVSPTRFATVLLQMAHRLGTVALLALLGTGYLAFAGHDFYAVLATSSGSAIVGFCAALLILSFTRRSRPHRREAVGVGIFNAAIAVIGMTIMLIARAGVIQDAVREGGTAVRAQVQDFFTAPPALPPQP